jgi:hypothetical protein
MKLNLNARELLAVYDLLHDTCIEGDASSRGQLLQQVHSRLKAFILNSLSDRQKEDDLRSWLDGQRKKITELQSTGQPSTEPADALDGTDDYQVPDYPRRNSGPRGQRNRGRNKQ